MSYPASPLPNVSVLLPHAVQANTLIDALNILRTLCSGLGLSLDCTIAGIINEAMLDSGVDVKAVTTRGALGRDIVQHRAALLAHIAAAWEGVEIGDIEYPLMSPISLVDIGEIVMVEARRTSDQQWFRIPLVPLAS